MCEREQEGRCGSDFFLFPSTRPNPYDRPLAYPVVRVFLRKSLWIRFLSSKLFFFLRNSFFGDGFGRKLGSSSKETLEDWPKPASGLTISKPPSSKGPSPNHYHPSYPQCLPVFGVTAIFSPRWRIAGRRMTPSPARHFSGIDLPGRQIAREPGSTTTTTMRSGRKPPRHGSNAGGSAPTQAFESDRRIPKR